MNNYNDAYNYSFKCTQEQYDAFMRGYWGFDFNDGTPSFSWEGQPKKISVRGRQLNTAIYDEAIVLEINGQPTLEAMRERWYHLQHIPELKPIIDFVKRHS